MYGLDFVLFKADPTGTAPQQPSFRIHAGKCTLESEEKPWILEDAHAVIFDPDRGDTVLTARRGRFDQAQETVCLEGDVVLENGQMRIALTDLSWRNAEGVARSDKPLTLVDGETNLTASGMVYYPAERRLILTKVAGRWNTQWRPEL